MHVCEGVPPADVDCWGYLYRDDTEGTPESQSDINELSPSEICGNENNIKNKASVGVFYVGIYDNEPSAPTQSFHLTVTFKKDKEPAVFWQNTLFCFMRIYFSGITSPITSQSVAGVLAF